MHLYLYANGWKPDTQLGSNQAPASRDIQQNLEPENKNIFFKTTVMGPFCLVEPR